MNEAKHTAEPWRWEFNEKHKTVSITGGRPTFDLTVMDFERWGMGGAVPRFRDTEHDGMNVMHRLCDRKDWFAPYAGREHHASWHANVIHPDARRIVACVNACAGVPTELLEEYPAPFSEMRAQRDQLLGLLRKFDSIMDGCGNWPDTSSSQVSLGDLAAEARATIAAVEGGQP